jgi:hypothetical protein
MIDWTELLHLALGAGLGTVVSAGFAQVFLRPLIRAEIKAHEGEVETRTALKSVVREEIDSHVQREDGLIRKRLDRESMDRETDLREILTELRALRDEVRELRGNVTGRHEAVSAPRATRAIEAPRGYSSPPDDTDR